MKQYRIFLSSTKCLLVKERKTIIDAILNFGHIPIAQEFDFQDSNGVPTLDKCIEKVISADAIILLLNSWYGSIINPSATKCDTCKIRSICPYVNSDNECKISYTHYEYLLAKLYNKKIYVLKKEGIDEDDNFTSSRRECELTCRENGRTCAETCKSNRRLRDIPENFFKWVKELRGGMVSEFSDTSTLISEVAKFMERISSDLESNDKAGVISCSEIQPIVDKSNMYDRVLKMAVCDVFENQARAIEDAEKTDFTIKNDEDVAVRVLCFRGNSFVNGADADWEPLIFSEINKGKKLEFVLADLENEDLLRRRHSSFPRYESFETFKEKYTKKMQNIEEILLSPDDKYTCELYLHNDANLLFRMIFVGEYLYLSFFLDKIPAKSSPVYKLKSNSALYNACKEYYERIKSQSIKREKDE